MASAKLESADYTVVIVHLKNKFYLLLDFKETLSI